MRQELLTHRTWDVSAHPQWLVFEVEGRLQIRPAQVVLAKRLLAAGRGADGGDDDARGPIAQLNMGEGKTRVCLPMMILELANSRHLVSCHMQANCRLGGAVDFTGVCSCDLEGS